MILITLDNINLLQSGISIIKKSRVMGSNKKNKYILLEPLAVELSNGEVIVIPKGFIWDLSSVPRFLWALFPPDGDFEIGALIHDFLYIKRKETKFKTFNTRKFADKEMLIWSMKVSGTDKISLRNFDNYMRYYVVRLFGGLVWNDKIKIK